MKVGRTRDVSICSFGSEIYDKANEGFVSDLVEDRGFPVNWWDRAIENQEFQKYFRRTRNHLNCLVFQSTADVARMRKAPVLNEFILVRPVHAGANPGVGSEA